MNPMNEGIEFNFNCPDQDNITSLHIANKNNEDLAKTVSHNKIMKLLTDYINVCWSTSQTLLVEWLYTTFFWVSCQTLVWSDNERSDTKMTKTVDMAFDKNIYRSIYRHRSNVLDMKKLSLMSSSLNGRKSFAVGRQRTSTIQTRKLISCMSNNSWMFDKSYYKYVNNC